MVETLVARKPKGGTRNKDGAGIVVPHHLDDPPAGNVAEILFGAATAAGSAGPDSADAAILDAVPSVQAVADAAGRVLGESGLKILLDRPVGHRRLQKSRFVILNLVEVIRTFVFRVF